ncbi:MAG TPA: hypothetical protein VK335_15665 [Bryobacteraceae bacterium]|nr:hypothetical protein [Bryobacteraceae bacterium]
MPTAHTCLVSFTDTNNIRHAVEVAASTLYEAATLAIAEFRRCGFTENAPGPATRLTVTLKGPSTSHEVQWGKVETWIQSAGKPNEQAMEDEATRVAARLKQNGIRIGFAHDS